MYMFRLDSGSTLADPDVSEIIHIDQFRDIPADVQDEYVCRVDFKDFDTAVRVAISASKLSMHPFIATDAGDHSHPRYDVIQAFQVGDKVSYAFNGDSYPDGTIVKIGGGRLQRIITSTGRAYTRYKMTGRWKSAGGGTWTLRRGHIYEQNPHF